MSYSDPGVSDTVPVRAGLGLFLGCALIFWSLHAPVGAATAYAYKTLRFAARDGAADCRLVQRGERVSLWPAGTQGGVPLVRLVEAPRCFAQLADMSVRPRPALRPIEARSWRFAVFRESSGKRLRGRVKRYIKVNARREPDLGGPIIKLLDSPESVAKLVGVVTGTDKKDWMEVILSNGQTAYIKRYLLETT